MLSKSESSKKLKRGVAACALIVATGLAGCSSRIDRFEVSEYENQSLPPAAQVKAQELTSAPTQVASLPPVSEPSEPITTSSLQPIASAPQSSAWQPDFSSSYAAAEGSQRGSFPSASLQRSASQRVPASLAKAPDKNLGWQAKGGSIVVLQRGETLDSLARKHNVPAAAIMHANRVTSPSAFKAGDSVIIPVREQTLQAFNSPQVATNPSNVSSSGIVPSSETASLAVATDTDLIQAERQEFGAQLAQLRLPPGNVGQPSSAGQQTYQPQYQQPAPVYRQPVQQQPLQPTYQPQRGQQAANPPVFQNQQPVYQERTVKITALPKSKPGTMQVAQTVTQPVSLAGISAVPEPKRVGSVAAPTQPVQVARAPQPETVQRQTQPTVTAQPAVASSRVNSSGVRQVSTSTVSQPVQRVSAPATQMEVAPAVQRVEPVQQAQPQQAEEVKTASLNPQEGTEPKRFFRWPVSGRIISDFGPKPGGAHNDGINLAVPEGTEIKATEDGTIVYSGNELKGFGNLVLIRHSNGWVSAYAHNSELLVRRGDSVRRGQVIAKAGATGSVSQPQLHFELRKDNKPVDPLQHLPNS
ncbi:peptidoglycan DD-metalloendopeptidase family protein [Pseudovibrio exalbescens]|uniref:peptidoglycan DD-metalloendopeptidase family protein n=1 Tax=Pseudovibrio exalbescens TaxID=197461 RepID=UPI0023664302|nr:peptidoglycan DD-metalloendopeptidase family protein [Pseudovibrio exalbescens]MDD7908750.1 peptidoglycan DD-metalloendopeptidase family protein [Pseudovibrio exalbescens]